MVQQLDELLSLSSRLQIANEDEVASSAMPRVADDFYSWQVYVPEGQEYELQLGMGAVFEEGIPPVVGSVQVPAGSHRVTLHTGDSASEEFRYVVYLDGHPVIDKAMGSDWMPNGWSSARGLSWPRDLVLSPNTHQLYGQSYNPKIDIGEADYFNGQNDNYVTRIGYRLWLAPPNRTFAPASPFIGFSDGRQHQGIGLRDGLRYHALNRPPYHWTFTRPKLETVEPVLRIVAEFFSGDKVILSSQTQAFQSWRLHNVDRENEQQGQGDPTSTAYSAELQAEMESDDAPHPIVELKWDDSRPDEVGLRLADLPENAQITGWRLRVVDGSRHLWRELSIDDRELKADNLADKSARKPAAATVPLDIGDNSSTGIRIRLQTDETLPLQVVERKRTDYAGMGLYNGLPLTLGFEIPASLKPTLAVEIVEHDPRSPEISFPGGPIFEALQFDLDATGHDWIWIEAKAKN